MRKKYYWYTMDPISVWHMVRKGTRLKTFPKNYLNKEICRILIRNLVLDELHLRREEILNINKYFLSKYSLGGLKKIFDNKVYLLLMYSFPEYNLNEWEFKKIYNKLWEDPEIRKKYVLFVAKEENIDLNNITDLRRFSAKLFTEKYKGSKALKYAGGLFELIKPVIPEDFKEWEIFKTNVWTNEKAKEAMLWLAEEKLNLKKPYPSITVKNFYDNNLGGLLCKFFDNSPKKATLFLNSL